ncbi:MAG TPA: type 4a pilus biogenesis protein PilO [Pyrinomonadaceae bacterium]|jgi:type IV pilus assembly protein PilO|nr:type 4a pilus biogenesis protein PilO [Pyrinomonadaceae bacterium]
MKLGKLPTLPWYLRLMVFLVVAGLAYGGFYYFVTSGTRIETKGMNDEIASLRPRNAQAQIVSQNLNNFKAVYKAREEEFAELKALLPEQRELTMVLQGIQDRAKGNGLVLTRFSPKEDMQQDNYSGKKIEVNVVSSFAGLRAFFEQLAHYQRIVSISNFELKQLEKQSPNKTVDARFDLTAYYVASERLQPQQPANAKGAAGGTVPAPAPAPPPPAK